MRRFFGNVVIPGGLFLMEERASRVALVSLTKGIPWGPGACFRWISSARVCRCRSKAEPLITGLKSPWSCTPRAGGGLPHWRWGGIPSRGSKFFLAAVSEADFELLHT